MASAIVMGLIFGRPEAADLSGYDALRGNLRLLVAVLALVYVASSFGEEVTYRGFLITRVAELGAGGRAAWRIGVLISSVVFGLVHFSWGPTGMVQTGVMGLALGACYLALGRRLWPLIFAHVYLDTLLLVQVFLAPLPRLRDGFDNSIRAPRLLVKGPWPRDAGVRQAEPVVQPDCAADDLGREPMAAVAGKARVHLPTLPAVGST